MLIDLCTQLQITPNQAREILANNKDVELFLLYSQSQQKSSEKKGAIMNWYASQGVQQVEV